MIFLYMYLQKVLSPFIFMRIEHRSPNGCSPLPGTTGTMASTSGISFKAEESGEGKKMS